MAAKQTGVRVKLNSQVLTRKLIAGVTLIAFLVMVISSLKAGVGVVALLWRALAVFLVLWLIGRVLITVMSTYEEMSGGQNKA